MVTEASAQPMIRKVAKAFRRPRGCHGGKGVLSTNANRNLEFPAPMWICHQQAGKKKGVRIHQVRGDINRYNLLSS